MSHDHHKKKPSVQETTPNLFSCEASEGFHASGVVYNHVSINKFVSHARDLLDMSVDEPNTPV